MARVIPFAFWVCLLLSSCTGYRQTDKLALEQQKQDSATVVQLPKGQFNNLSLTLTNTADSVQSFYLSPNGYDFSSHFALASSIIKGTSTDEGKAIAIWKFIKNNTSHSLPYTNAHLPHDPIRLVASFGSGLCDDRNTALAVLFKQAGLDSRVIELGGHMVAEVEYDNAWHMFDADLGIYYLDSKAKVASVKYISKHPEIVKTDFGEGVWRSILTKLTTPYIRSIYSSQQNNKVNVWQSRFPFRCEIGAVNPYLYKCESTLNSGDEIQLKVNSINTFDKFLRVVFTHNLSGYDSKGTLKRNVVLNTTRQKIIDERSAYAVTQLRLRAEELKSNTQVYYSPDGLRWFYKGTLTNCNEIVFVPFSVEDEPCSFRYFIKYVPENGNLSGTVKSESDFLFSPLLFTNPEKTFKIVSADSTALKGLSVKMEYTK